MQIELQQLFPLALKERLEHKVSGIWNQQLLFDAPEWIKIEAPSGTGKTTFTSFYTASEPIILGLFYLTGKRSEHGGNCTCFHPSKKLSVVFQDLKLFPQLKAWENIEIKRQLVPDACSEASMQLMAERLGIAHLLQQPTYTCSYGEQQRIAIIRALVQPFEWILMDEPFSHLDQENTSKAAALIMENCLQKNAGLIITGLNEDHHFEYHRRLFL